ncbi:MAG TPA: hypothetical protein VHG27_08740, partial [Xanthobacteraceae bacterium]|nr:hypothetical protein [Xanthobacteraceae bacterium]
CAKILASPTAPHDHYKNTKGLAMTLHRKAALALAAALTALTIGTAAAQSVYRPAAPYAYGCYTGDACGNYDSYGRGN